MDLEKKFRPAMVTTELALGIGLAVVALFVAIGLFYQPLENMVKSTGLKNMFNGDAEKTGYSYLNRDYSKSQINVQIAGEQGLLMLRKRANNKALELINEDFSSTNPNGSSLAYLAVAVNILSGEPHFCKFMNEDSVERCDDITGYNYKVAMNSSAITISEVNLSGSSVVKTVSMPLAAKVMSLLSSASSINVTGVYAQTMKMSQKYEAIYNMTKALLAYIRSDVALVGVLSTYTNSGLAPSASFTSLKAEATTFASDLTVSVRQAYSGCSDVDYGGSTRRMGVGCTGYHTVSESDYNKMIAWQSSLNAQLKTAKTPAEVASMISQSLTKEIVGVVENDNYVGEDSKVTRKKSSQLLKESLAQINAKYNVGIVIPDCEPSGTIADTVIGDTIIKVTDKVTNVAVDAGKTVVNTVKSVGSAIKDFFGF